MLVGKSLRNNECEQHLPEIEQATDTTKTLAEVTIPSTRYPAFFTGNKFVLLNQQLLDQNNQNSLAQLLTDHSQMFIKSYGQANLASPGFRGGNANHTPVLWNGFNLQSTMNGQVDMALFPAFLTEGVAIQYGSPATLFGSGAMGGAIHLQTLNPIQQGLKGEVMTGIESYHAYSNGIKLFYRTDKLQVTQKVFAQNALNNFDYKNISLVQNSYGNDPLKIANAPTQRAPNAAYEALAWMQEISYYAGKRHSFNLRSWVQKNERDIPPALSLIDLHAHQTDKTTRITGEYKYTNAFYELNVRHGIFDDYLSYSDLNTGTAVSKSQSNISYLDQFFKLKKQLIQISLMNQISVATNTSYTGFAQQHRLALFGSYKWFWLNQKLEQQFSLRQEWVNGKAIPVMPSYGFELALYKRITLSGNTARSYRLPTFNDLYWAVLGNPNLLPESGWNEELSITYKSITNKPYTIQTSLTGYNKNISNWIIWVPDQNGTVSPRNITQVRSRGIEAGWKLSRTFGKTTLFATGLHDLTLATNTQATSISDSSLNKQLIYTPRIKHVLSAGVNYKGYTLTYYHHYTGTRFVSTDNNSWLLPYTTAKICGSKAIIVKGCNLLMQAAVNNLFNETYQVIVNRPMPLRNYQLSITLKF